jgi:Zn-dependent protease
MLPTAQGSLRLFTAFGVTVFIHWSWFLIAAILVGTPGGKVLFGDWLWHAAAYMTLFGIVMLHEFGHALACRSVGGLADRIVLWPLGGVAYVQPPPRPGAVLWSIAAGPLVNVLLVPVTFGLLVAAGRYEGAFEQYGDLERYLYVVFVMNLSLLVFNMLPVYPLDGGQMLQALLWYGIGRTRSLRVSAVIGMIVAAVGAAAALWAGYTWLVIIAVFIGWQSFNGWIYARRLAEYERLQRQNDLL